MDTSLRELVNQPAVDGSKAYFSFFGTLTHSWDIVQHPADLCPGEVRVQLKACLGTENLGIFRMTSLKLFGEIGSPAALPNYRVAHRKACSPVPQDHRLSLVRDADSGNILVGRSCLAKSLAGN